MPDTMHDPTGSEESTTTIDDITTGCGAIGAPTYENFGASFFLTWCTGCHASQVPMAQRQGAPLAINFDHLAEIRQLAPRVLARTVDNLEMPPAGGPSPAERERLQAWLACGAPGSDGNDFDPMFTDQTDDSTASQACAQPRIPLPADVLPRCEAATLTCVRSCRDGVDDANDPAACEEACLDADTMPPAAGSGDALVCKTCVQWQQLACGQVHGCEAANASLLCCAQTCEGQSDADCVATRCARELEAFYYCYGYRAPQCVTFEDDLILHCFAAL